MKSRIRIVAPLLVCLGFAGCKEEDNFRCGIRVGDKDVSRCTGPSEVCLCGPHRCARVDLTACGGENQSGYTFVFPEKNEGCVPKTSLQNVIAQQASGDDALCPDQRPALPSCGAFSNGLRLDCPAETECLCELNQCAIFRVDEETCPTGWRSANDPAQCIELNDKDTGIRPDPSTKLCPGASIPPRAIVCGMATELGKVMNCNDDDTCVCASHRCAFPSEECDSGLRYRSQQIQEEECVDESDRRDIVSKGLCKGDRLPLRSCGVLGGDGEVLECGASRRCACRVNACVEDDTTCTSRYRFVDQGLCAPPDVVSLPETLLMEGLCSPGCGVLDSEGRIVNCPIGDCVCSTMGGRCVVEDNSCPSKLANLSDNSCVRFTEGEYQQTISPGALCSQTPEPKTCGVEGSDGRLQSCETNRKCACISGSGSCSEEEPTCPSGMRFEVTRRCVPSNEQLIDRGLCPQAQIPTPIPCGTFDQAGRVLNCLGEERCLCRTAGGLCAAPANTCPSGFEGAHDLSCLQLSETDFLSDLEGGQICRGTAPEDPNCGSAQDDSCETGGCLCTRSGGKCALSNVACPSGYAFSHSRMCAPNDPENRFISSGTCQSVQDGGL